MVYYIIIRLILLQLIIDYRKTCLNLYQLFVRSVVKHDKTLCFFKYLLHFTVDVCILLNHVNSDYYIPIFLYEK